MKSELLRISALSSVVLGKILVALGLTPSIRKSRKTQESLIFYGSLLQINGDSIVAEFHPKGSPYRFGTQLEALGYVIGTFAFIVFPDPFVRLKFLKFNNLDQVLGGTVILTDKNAWKENYLVVGNVAAVIGNFLLALGTTSRMRSPAPLSYIDPLETKGAWTTMASATIILLGELARASGLTFQSD
ncbi:DUF6944 family repetitive protein [Sporolactobacillus pectinivorans]|uniref:DUF6944 family repetitive protein n=1 Tax=Sporolactobacillus pectinivorans TaxID=1591408 RepID=UPI000C256945|nr:hypothetical protein [Sporolactobacillus pectinivorans]